MEDRILGYVTKSERKEERKKVSHVFHLGEDKNAARADNTQDVVCDKFPRDWSPVRSFIQGEGEQPIFGLEDALFTWCSSSVGNIFR